VRLLTLLGFINQIEKNSFLKILDELGVDARKSGLAPVVERILLAGDGKLKNVDDSSIASLFKALENAYSEHLRARLAFGDRQLSLLVDILIRDGNAIMSREWFAELYKRELERLGTQVQAMRAELKIGQDIVQRTERQRDYAIYVACVKEAMVNDQVQNRESRITWDERTILNTLAQSLGLSLEEVRMIEYNVLDIEPLELDTAISLLKESGIIFYQRKSCSLYIADEICWLLRELRGVRVANKYKRRVLRHLQDAELNRVAKRYGVDRKLERVKQIDELLRSGIQLDNILSVEMFRSDTPKSDRAGRVQSLMEKDLEIDLAKYGRSLEQKIDTLLSYFRSIERDDAATLSADGYEKLLNALQLEFPEVNQRVKRDFELQPPDVMKGELLSSYSIQPRDVLYLLSKTELKAFCKAQGISNRGNLIANVLKQYRNIDDLMLENIELIGARDVLSLQEKGLNVRESELGLLYEKLVKKAFAKLGLTIDEKLAKRLNTKRAQMDALIRVNDTEVIVVECKTRKDKTYNNYAAVKRQLVAYEKLCIDRGFQVLHVLIVANDFTEDFVGDAEYDEELSLSLLTSRGLARVVESYGESERPEFPIKLLLKAGLLNEERIAKVLTR
jgi:hypothetical protein